MVEQHTKLNYIIKYLISKHKIMDETATTANLNQVTLTK